MDLLQQAVSLVSPNLVYRLICSWHMAAGQLAVFQGGSDEHI